jgi:hypothetical protein
MECCVLSKDQGGLGIHDLEVKKNSLTGKVVVEATH